MKKSKTDRNITKLKLALTTGGLLATMIGAGLLGRETAALPASTSSNSAETATSRSDITFEAPFPEDLNLNLEAIPTAAAPVMRRAPVATGRSSA